MTPSPVLVVGGSGGIGAAVAARWGERAVVWSRHLGVDATDPTSVAQAARALLDEKGPPWALVHTVGDFAERALLATDLAWYREMIDSNLTSAFLIVRALVPAMVEAGRGRVLLWGAAGAGEEKGMVRAPVYFAAKAALVSMTRSLAAEVAASGVTVNMVAPGLIVHEQSDRDSQERMAPRVPMGRSGTVDDLLGLVDYLLSESSGYVTGRVFTVDGGLSL